MIKLFVGLGNPGAEYEGTRHNAGFVWVDALALSQGAPFKAEKGFFGLATKIQLQGHSAWLLKPQTFMNRSGQSVGALARFYKIAPEEILVIHDELDLLPGQSKLKFSGSHAGHNGLKSVEASLGSKDYWRLRIGVGHPGVRSEVINWVLKRPSSAHRDAIEDCISRSMESVPYLVNGEFEAATRLINKKPSVTNTQE